MTRDWEKFTNDEISCIWKMTQKYDLESLIETFAEHAKQSDVDRENLKKRFAEEGTPEPDYMKNDFSISKALCEMCKHINSLRDDVSKIWDHILEIED